MKDRWRPKGWRNWYTPQPEKKIFTEADVLSQAVDAAFEAGADAMLEALKKEGYHFTSPYQVVFDRFPKKSGWMIIIPDEVG